MDKPINIGIVGLGRAGNGMHLNELKNKTDKFRVAAVCDIIPERAERAARELSCRVYFSIEDMLKDSEVELADIATRTIDHYRHALAALEAGKKVFLEKPACCSYDEFLKLVEYANGSGDTRLYVRQNRRFEAVFNYFLNTVRSGLLGNVFDIRISQMGYQRRDDWQTLSRFGGGQLLNWGPHIIDQALVLLGSQVKSMSSDLKQAAAGGDCEDHFSVYLRGENGRSVSLCISGAAALGQGRKYEAYGDRGAMICENNLIKARYINPEQILPAVVSDPGTPGQSFGSSGTFEAAVTPEWVETEKTIDTEDLSVIWDYLYESIRNGKPFPVTDSEVLSVMKVISAAKEEPIVLSGDIDCYEK